MASVWFCIEFRVRVLVGAVFRLGLRLVLGCQLSLALGLVLSSEVELGLGFSWFIVKC